MSMEEILSARKLRIFHKLQIAAHHLQKKADREIATVSELTTAQVAVLWILSKAENQTQKDVAVALGFNESALTAMIGRLVRLGYAEKKRGEKDRRAWAINLTTHGRKELSLTSTPFKSVNTTIEDEFTSEELETFAEYLVRLNAALKGTQSSGKGAKI